MSTETPDPISIKRVKEITGLSRATIWRRIADGTLQVASWP
jgi:predicted DNA-binding transcriptional regulator AlpA